MNKKCHIIMYHYVRELPLTRYPKIKGLLLSQFKDQLDYLAGAGYRFVSVSRILEAAAGGSLPEKSVFLTFDDGYLDHYTNVFPVLHSRGIPAFFSMPGKILAEKKVLDVNKIHFLLASREPGSLIPLIRSRLDYYRGAEYELPSFEELYSRLAVASRFDDADTIFIKRLLQVELPEKLRNQITDELFREVVTDREESFVTELYMSMDQVRMMAANGMDWGIHGYDHYWMNRLSPEALKNDIQTALDVFGGVVPRDGWWVVPPYGSVNDDVICCAASLGAAAGLTTEVRQADLECDDIYRLPRWDTNDFPPKSRNFEQKP